MGLRNILIDCGLDALCEMAAPLSCITPKPLNWLSWRRTAAVASLGYPKGRTLHSSPPYAHAASFASSVPLTAVCARLGHGSIRTESSASLREVSGRAIRNQKDFVGDDSIG